MSYFFLRHHMSGAGALSETPVARDIPVTCVSLEEDRLVLRRRPAPEDLRPGPLWSGPALLSYVDAAAFLLTIAHLPPGSDAFTTDLAIKFLRPAPFRDLVADVRLLRLSKRRADLDIVLTVADEDGAPIVHATAAFAPRPAGEVR